MLRTTNTSVRVSPSVLIHTLYTYYTVHATHYYNKTMLARLAVNTASICLMFVTELCSHIVCMLYVYMYIPYYKSMCVAGWVLQWSATLCSSWQRPAGGQAGQPHSGRLPPGSLCWCRCHGTVCVPTITTPVILFESTNMYT